MRRVRYIENFFQDLRYGLRMMRCSPGFTAAIVLSLALGIGVNTAIFGLIDSLLLKTLPIKSPEQLVVFGSIGQDAEARDYRFYYPVFRGLLETNRSFVDIAAFAAVQLNLKVDGEIDPDVSGELVSGSYFSLLGINAAAGRLIGIEDDRVPGEQPVAVISYDYWKRRFGLARSALGTFIEIDGTPFTIIGVTPPHFLGMEVGQAPEVTVPLMMQPQVMPDTESWLGRPQNVVDWLHIVGRLKPGVSHEQALADTSPRYQRILAEQAATFDASWARNWASRRLILDSASKGISQVRQQFSRPLFILMAVVGFVLLIACANVASLLVGRATARQRELATRLAVGAGRARLIRQLLTEIVLLTIIGAAAAPLIASWSGRLLTVYISAGRVPLVLDLRPDLNVGLFTAVLAVVAMVLCGLPPAVYATKAAANSCLSQSVRRTTPSRSLGAILVVSQVAITLLLLVVAGLFERTVTELLSQDAAFHPDYLLITKLEPKGSDSKRGETAIRLNNLYRSLEQSADAIPGVLSASLAGASPTDQIVPDRLIETRSGAQVRAAMVMVFPNYFATTRHAGDSGA